MYQHHILSTVFFSTQYPQLTGCDPTVGGCNPGLLPIKISDPVPCDDTTPKAYYRSSTFYYQALQMTGMNAALDSVNLLNVDNTTFRMQYSTFVSGVLLNLDGFEQDKLPPTLDFVVKTMDGTQTKCSVPTGAVGTTTPCSAWEPAQ